MRIVRVDKECFIPIGRLGEKESTMVIFDISDWKTIYGDGIFSLVCQRNGESAPYIAVIEQTETEVHWVVKDADVGIKGYGKCELIYTVGDAIAKSEIYGTVVGDALQGGSVPPEPWEDWVERVLAAGVAAQDAAVSASASAESAEHSAEVASEKAGEAETSAINANISAQAAHTASTHYPKISDANRHWLVWDAISAAYVDTEIIAEGKDGADGTSVTVSAVSESTADGGQNIVTFSDGKTLTVKNGSKGSQGEKGDPTDVQQKTGQSTTAVMSQKAVTDNLAKKVEMVSSASPVVQLYGVRYNSTETMMLEAQTSMAKKDSIPRRNANGTFAVGTPTNPTDAVNKEYVDNKLFRQKYISTISLGNGESYEPTTIGPSSIISIVCTSGDVFIMGVEGENYANLSCNDPQNPPFATVTVIGDQIMIQTGFISAYDIVYGGEICDATTKFALYGDFLSAAAIPYLFVSTNNQATIDVFRGE